MRPARTSLAMLPHDITGQSPPMVKVGRGKSYLAQQMVAGVGQASETHVGLWGV